MVDEKSTNAIAQFNNSLAKKYKDNPLPSATLSVLSNIPVVGMIVEGGQVILEHKIDKIYYDRLITLLNELNSSNQAIPDELIEEEQFIHSVFLIYKAVINTYQREKIQYFARILKTSIEQHKLASDKFEEFVNILTDLSSTELSILELLHKFESNRLIEDFWTDFTLQIEVQLGIQKEELIARLARLNRTGLYKTFTGSSWGYKGDQGKTTTLFQEFSEWIELENNSKEI